MKAAMDARARARDHWCRIGVLVTLIVLGCADPAPGQQWIFDAREIALGAVGRQGIVTADMVEAETEQRHTTVVLPVGLFQVFRDSAMYDPGSKEFDPVLAIEFASAPFHYVAGRDTSGSAGRSFASDVRNALVNRDLGGYRGFSPVGGHLAEAVASPAGHLFVTHPFDDRPVHGVYVGVGPYLSVDTTGTVDPRLQSLLNGSAAVRNANLAITDAAIAQLALAVTGGYRIHFRWPDDRRGRRAREGIYVGANYNYLRGFLHENDDLNIDLDIDGAGLLADSSNLLVRHQHATGGSGFAIDLGTTVIVDRWEIAAGANGVLNRIVWTDVEAANYSLASLTTGRSDFLQTSTMSGLETRVVLPVDYRGAIRYDGGDWSATMGVRHGLGGLGFHAGIERRLSRLAVRGGGHYQFEAWNPSGGVGFVLSPRVSADVAVFGTSANVERKRQMGIGASLRINHSPRRS